MVNHLKTQYKHYITILILLAMAMLVIPYWTSILRLCETVVDFALSVAFYFCEFAHLLANVNNPITPTVNTFSDVLDIEVFLPKTGQPQKAY